MNLHLYGQILAATVRFHFQHHICVWWFSHLWYSWKTRPQTARPSAESRFTKQSPMVHKNPSRRFRLVYKSLVFIKCSTNFDQISRKKVKTSTNSKCAWKHILRGATFHLSKRQEPRPNHCFILVQVSRQGKPKNTDFSRTKQWVCVNSNTAV